MAALPIDQWLLLDSGPCSPAFNMALDEALMESSASLRRPVFRSYGWSEPAATFGYFQRYPEIAATTSLRPLIRRPTAGGLVPHTNDWTYSLVIPPSHWWYTLRAEESYRRVHEWLRTAFAMDGIDTQLARDRDPTGPGQCFVGAERNDLLQHGQKIAGAAQRRSRLALLIQGSIQPPPPGLTRTSWQQAMQRAASEWPAEWERFDDCGDLFARAEQLVAAKYGRSAHNQNR